MRNCREKAKAEIYLSKRRHNNTYNCKTFIVMNGTRRSFQVDFSV